MLTPETLLQNRYRIRRPLGHGGMGQVYEATDERLGRTVAVKELIVEGEMLRRAFEREARLLAHLSHPSLPRVTDHFAEGAGHYLVMDFVPGDDLKAMLENRAEPFPVREVLAWADALLDVLEYLHGREPPVIHRDIKPANLKLLRNGRVALLDFGLAKGGTGQTTGTMSRSVFGYSPHFASLEQMQGERSSPRSDIYSLSATLYYLLTKTPPCDALTRAAAVFNEEPDPLVPVEELRREVPREVASLIMSGLGLKTSARPSSAAEMRARLNGSHAYAQADDDEATRVNVNRESNDADARGHETHDARGTRDARESEAARPSPVGLQQAARVSPTPNHRGLVAAAVVVCLLAVVSSVGYILFASRGARGTGANGNANVNQDANVVPPQLRPAAAAVQFLFATDANGQSLAGGGGYFVSPSEAVAPLSAIEGATTVSISTTEDGPPRRVASVTRVDRERGVVVVKIDGNRVSVPDMPTGAPPASGEKVKLIGPGAMVRMSEGVVNAQGKGTFEVRAAEQSVGPGWLVVRETGEFVGLLTERDASGDFALFDASAVADLMKKKPAPQPIEVVGAKDALYDFRDSEGGGPPKLAQKEQDMVFDAVFGPRQSKDDADDADCDEDHDKCLAADRANGYVEPEVLARVEGAFTQQNARQVAYLLAAHEWHAGHVDNFGSKWLAVFDGQRLVFKTDAGDYWDIPKTPDLNRDGVSELLLSGVYTQMGETLEWAELVDLRGGKLKVIKDFENVYTDDCAAISPDKKIGALIFYTPSAAGAFPNGFRKDVFRAGCGDKASWKYAANQKVPSL